MHWFNQLAIHKTEFPHNIAIIKNPHSPKQRKSLNPTKVCYRSHSKVLPVLNATS
jgi:GR25 family glycosyltransferase involved in LPS biosynthesis